LASFYQPHLDVKGEGLQVFARLKERSGPKRAIVAMARKLMCVLYAMLWTSTPYKVVTTDTKAPRTTRKKLVRISRKEQTAILQTTTAEQTATPQTATPGTARKQSTTATTAKQTTIPQTTASRTTRKKLLTRPTPEQATTT